MVDGDSGDFDEGEGRGGEEGREPEAGLDHAEAQGPDSKDPGDAG